MENQIVNTKNFLKPECKISRASSFTELSTTKKFIVEQKLQLESGGSLVRQYSCEHILNNNSESHFRVCQQSKYYPDAADSKKFRENLWIDSMPLISKPCNKSSDDSPTLKLPNQFNQLSLSSDVNQVQNHQKKQIKLKSILAPPILNLNQKLQNKTDDKVLSIEAVPREVPITSIEKFDFKKDDFIFKRPIFLQLTNQPQDINDSNKNVNNTSEYKKDARELKKNLRSLVLKEPKPKSRKSMKIFILLFLFASVLLTVSAFFSVPGPLVNFLKNYGYCQSKFNTASLKLSLKNRILGQPDVYEKISNSFVSMNDKFGIEVFAFLGGIGVGKTHASEIIKKELKRKNYNIIEYFSSFYEKKEDAHKKISRCKCNLLILENLKSYDIELAASFINNLKRKVALDKYKPCIIIFTIFNTEEVNSNLIRRLNTEESVEAIRSSFNINDILEFTLLVFQPLDDETLTKCIRIAALEANVKLSNEDVANVRDELKMSNTGCKNAYAKVQIFGSTNTKTERTEL